MSRDRAEGGRDDARAGQAPNCRRHRVVYECLGIVADEIAAEHCVALSWPRGLADMLIGYVAALERR